MALLMRRVKPPLGSSRGSGTIGRMAVTDCEACGNRVNSQAVVCPHCGARRAKVTMADAKLDKDEIRALLITDNQPVVDDGRGLASTMFLPHDQTTGRARTLELALTVISAPLVASGLITIVLGRRRLRRRLLAAKGEAISALVMSFFGGLGLYSIADLLKLPALPITAVSIVAVWIRALIRSNAASWRTREMAQLAKADEAPRASAPKLPQARAVTAPSPVVRPSAPIEAPKAEPATPPGEEPRLLR
jgi:hypothetical protein